MARKKLTNTYMSMLCLELSMLLHAGITIDNGVSMMLDDEKDKEGRMVLQSLLDNLTGRPLFEALRDTEYFPPYMVNMVEIGEKTGRIAETLKALSDHYERQERLAISIKNAALYPAILLGMMIVVVLILIVQVLPIFNDVFGRMGAQMSPFAMQLMQFGAWFRGASVVIAIIACVIFALGFLLWVLPGVKDSIIISIKNTWGDSGLMGRIASSQFVSSMALSMSSGLNVEDSINMSASLNSDSKALKAKYEKCRSLLESGSNLPDALRDAGILSARDSRMLSLGEHSGMADSAMSEVARRSDQMVQDEIASIVSRIEPSLVILTSVIVGIILLSVMLPLVGIMTALG